ncbi:S-methyl-5'-thioinosine phosphorylase [Halothiobacillus sp.]|jgi:5'-methylthioinosine phosphorylase|uniref:S-methyl-5'-thioinosine phosphorylase n=1 Tax=Halothiobacillus sp. TaxID=1891311 RepID=UPI002AD55FAA|nr:S-methyl-5'-thioinosine phosphorylase [Halothiobacillus sp.]
MYLAIIGGTGLSQLDGMEEMRHQVVSTPYGEPSGPITVGRMGGQEILFLPRHGYNHRIAPHEINYRANIWALREMQVTKILAVSAVGGISATMTPGSLCVPDQIIDYTWGRPSTFFEGDLESVTHVDFSYPYDEQLRNAFLQAGAALSIPMIDGGTYGATQGPRFETAAEIRRLEQDGCHVVGMTGMPEAVLARESDIRYASLNVVGNWAAGRSGPRLVSMAEISQTLRVSMKDVRRVLGQILQHQE